MTGKRQTWDLSEFHGGIDLRDGLFSSNQTRFRELKNLWIDKGRKLRRRPPCLKLDGAFSANCQGLISIDGRKKTFAKKGDTVTHTGAVASEVDTLYFDNPDLCTTWELIAATVFDGYACALIRHTFPSTEYPYLVFLHVWDGLVYAPTYVQDPYFPGSFSPSIADLSSEQVYDGDFTPVIGQGATKAWTSTMKGNAQCSATADARVWNSKTSETILQDGEEYCFVIPEGIATRSFIVPRDATWLDDDGKWAYYVCEWSNGDAWQVMSEGVGSGAKPYYDAVSVASRFAGGWNEIRLDVHWGLNTAGLIRFRMCAGGTAVDVTKTPSVELTPGTGTAWKAKVGEAQYRFNNGDAITDEPYETADFVNGKTYLLNVGAYYLPRLINLTDDGFPNGHDRFGLRLLKRIVVGYNGATAKEISWYDSAAMTGTVEITTGTNTITGTGTNWNTTLNPGDEVSVAGQLRTILARTSDTAATVTVNWASSAGPGAIILKLTPHWAYFDGVDTRVSTSGLGTVKVGTILKINSVDYTVSALVSSSIFKITKYDSGTKTWVSGNYVSAIDAAYSIYPKPIIEDYRYAFNPEAGSQWYDERVLEAADAAGSVKNGTSIDPDALFLNTSSHDNTGGRITAIAAIRQRMLITYPWSMQLWAIDQNSNQTAYLDQMQFGTGEQETPPTITWYGAIITPVSNAVRAISVVGSNTDNLQDLNIGEPIEPMAYLGFNDGVFWPKYGQVVMAGYANGGLEFRVLDYSRESKITAWSQWIVAGSVPVDVGTMIPDGSKLWFRSGTALRYFDAESASIGDYGEAAGSEYLGSWLLHFNDMGKPGTNKRFVAMDIVQDGICTVGFQMPQYGSWGSETTGPVIAGPQIEGISYGRVRIPLAMTGPAIAIYGSTRSLNWKLQRISLDFMTLRR